MKKSFIEVQFPVSKISKESYKERKANLGQTLTGLGKWWGRKPLILVRAVILGALIPASDNPKKDMEIFLKILSMDDDGLIQRKIKTLPLKVIFEECTREQQEEYFDMTNKGPKLKAKIDKKQVELEVFKKITYDEKLKYCIRPEELPNIKDESWEVINEYLGTDAYKLQELVQQLSIKKYGRNIKIGDCFSGGGSVPFESSRLGADVYGSDLNPIAGMLTWAGLNLGKTNEDIIKIEKFQELIFNQANKIVENWGIETNEDGDRGNSYLYCIETICPECGYTVPLAPSWVIGKGSKTIAVLKENNNKGFNIEIETEVTEELLTKADKQATIQNSQLVCPHCKRKTPIAAIRKDGKCNKDNNSKAITPWRSDQVSSEPANLFTERLYCIKYEKEVVDQNGKIIITRYYVAPSAFDYKREERVRELLQERLQEWGSKGYLPKLAIEKGEKTQELHRTRGWTMWQHVFNERQLLIHGLLMNLIDINTQETAETVAAILGVNKCCNWNSKLSRWNAGAGVEKVVDTFSNQALNTMYNFGTRGLKDLKNVWKFNIPLNKVNNKNLVNVIDAREVNEKCDIWITDPPYADAVNYHELTEFFLAWDRTFISKAFPNWYTDSRRVLAVRGTGDTFNHHMIEIYSNLKNNMNDDGMQVVMFTHQDVKVWAELALILWSSELRVTAAWNIATETDAIGLKDGNYVKGTVNLILRKQLGDKTAYLDELYMDIEDEVKAQIDSMHKLDEGEEPNFSDGDYLLAAYAASLKVLTSYKNIEDIDLEYELKLARENPEKSEVVRIINEARKIAYDYLIPKGFDSYHWKSLSSEERFYIKGLELQKNGCYQLGLYQELARGFGVVEYTDILASTRANQVRLKTPNDYEMKNIGDTSKFGNTLVRTVLAAVYITEKEESPNKGLGYIKKEVANYWSNRELIIEILNYMDGAERVNDMEATWGILNKSISMLKTVVENDSI